MTQVKKKKIPLGNGVVYDRAKNHFLGHFPASLPIEKGFLHIGMFLGWISENDLYSKMFEEESALHILRFRKRELGCAIFSAIWDGYLASELLNEEGIAFCDYYYASGKFLKDYEKELASDLPSIYHVDDSWENYETMAKKISAKYKRWKKDS